MLHIPYKGSLLAMTAPLVQWLNADLDAVQFMKAQSTKGTPL
jgi:hypothetical protein